MTQTEMLEYLERLREAYQKYRSIVMENVEEDNDVLGEMNPWVFGEKCPLRAIQKVLDRGHVEKMEFRNFMYVLHYFTPEVMLATGTKFPEPDIRTLL